MQPAMTCALASAFLLSLTLHASPPGQGPTPYDVGWFTDADTLLAMDAPYRIALVADEGAIPRAEAFRKYLLGIEPFSKISSRLEIEIVTAPSEKMNCKNGSFGIDRLLDCDEKYIASLGAEKGAHLVAGITSKTRYGGLGGAVPVASVATPLNLLLHEMMHTWGFNDEYVYEDGDQALQKACLEVESFRRAPNITAFQPKVKEFASDAQAREMHQGDIPWYGKIKDSTLITHGTALGTTPRKYPADEVALFEGGSCEKVIPTWRPYYGDTIMKTLSSSRIPKLYQEHILKRMSAVLGEGAAHPLSLPPPPQPPSCR